MSAWKNIALLAGGFLIGTAGVKILGSKEARKVYAHTTAAVIRAKDCVMTKADEIREGCGDILAEARDINEKKEKECPDIIEDESENSAEETETKEE
ncbi:MAG: hypothetical protein II820_07600 [Ruminiclostridium sp.]|nr:hypothetical protein [Ruminiclostridium sp.]